MDGYQTPPTYAVETAEYTGGGERNHRIDYILGVLFNQAEMARFNRFFPQAAKQQEVILEPERMTFHQYQQLKIVKQEEDQMLRISGEPHSQVMNRLNYYAEVMDVFEQMEPTYLELSLLLTESMPDDALLFRQRAQRANISEMYAMFHQARRLLQMNQLHP
jgi:hypothetical protein